MLDTAVAQVRLALAVMSGRPIPGWALARLLAGARATRHEFGASAAAGARADLGPALDAARTISGSWLRENPHPPARRPEGTRPCVQGEGLWAQLLAVRSA